MTHRTVYGLALSACLLACSSKTTSLGGPETNNNVTPSSTGDDSDPTSDAASAPAPEAEAGPPSPPSGGWQTACHGYSWDPEPSTAPCEYHLPPSAPPQNNDRRLDPKNWGPHPQNVVITTINVSTNEWNNGPFVDSSEDCGSGDGWYYVDPGDGGVASLFRICPKSCAAVNEGAWLRLQATTYCE